MPDNKELNDQETNKNEEQQENNQQEEQQNDIGAEPAQEDKQSILATIRDTLKSIVYSERKDEQTAASNEEKQADYEQQEEHPSIQEEQNIEAEAEQKTLHSIEDLKEQAKALDKDCDENMQSLMAVLADYEQKNGEHKETAAELMQAVKDKYSALQQTKPPVEIELEGETKEQENRNNWAASDPVEWLRKAYNK